MASHIGRRKFLATLGGVVAWPLAARGQQPERMRRVGVLMITAEDDTESKARIGAFRQGLKELGWSDGRNVRIDIRWGTADAERMRKHSAELVALAPDVILAAGGTPTVSALQQMTRTVPIVFVGVADPVGGGFVASLASPGGTGFTVYEYAISGKWLELLKEVAPHIQRAAILRDSAMRRFRSSTLSSHYIPLPWSVTGSEPNRSAAETATPRATPALCPSTAPSTAPSAFAEFSRRHKDKPATGHKPDTDFVSSP